MLWTVFNVRSPASSPVVCKLFLDDGMKNRDKFYFSMQMLIQSRYLVNVGVYYFEDGIRSFTQDEFFTKEELQVPPFVILVPSTGDVFVFTKLNGDVFSLFDSAESQSLGKTVGNEFRRLSGEAQSGTNLHPWPVTIHGLVPEEIRVTMGSPNSNTRNTVALEILLHTLVGLDLGLDTLADNKGRFSYLLAQSLNKCIAFPKFKLEYLERCCWAITRGELGHETEAMQRFNEKRGLEKVKRSSWNFKKRMDASFLYSLNGRVRKDHVLDLLNDFHPSDAITFSNNVVVIKKDVMDLVEAPLCDGVYDSVFLARVNALNTSYSDNGGPRLYTQRELDYMMTQVMGMKQRKRLTSRLLKGGFVFCLLNYEISPEAKKLNENADDHASLCKVYLEGPSNEIPKRHLVVEWLEGVFDNIFKLCAVPLLTYLSMYFGVQVKQIEYSRYRTLEIEDAPGPCVPTALYAANERMQRLVETRNRYDWEPYTLTLEEGQDYEFELVCSILFHLGTVKAAKKRTIEDDNTRTFKSIRREPPKRRRVRGPPEWRGEEQWE
jgi:hypothetical protein